MGAFNYVPRHEVDARHRTAARALPRGAREAPRVDVAPSAQQRNVHAVLDLGATRMFEFRGRVYRAPPLEWKAGQRLMTLYSETLIEGKKARVLGDAAWQRGYFANIHKMSRLLWRYTQSASKMLRVMRRLGLSRNPFRHATEKEIQELVDFFLKGRMRSTVRFSSETDLSA